MELRHLRYFIAVAEERSFSRAAGRLHIAQPPLSQQIRRLEAEFGFPLFERNAKGVRLTRSGEALLPAARRVIEAADYAREVADQANSGAAGRLTIAFINSAAYCILPGLFAAFRAAHPNIAVELREMPIADQLEALVDRRIDAGILRPPIDDRRLDGIKLLHEPFVLALPVGHALSSRRAVKLDDLDDQLLVGFPRAHPAGFREGIDSALRKAGVTPKYVQEATHVHTLCGLVAAGLGVSIVPLGTSVLGIRGIRFVPLDAPDLSAEVWLAWLYDSAIPQVNHLVRITKLWLRRRERCKAAADLNVDLAPRPK